MPLSDEDVEWIVNDNAELGVKIGNQFFFCYKGHSLVYETGKHDEGEQMFWRPIGKREFGECIHPINYQNPRLIGEVDVDDGNEWFAVPPAQ